MNRKLAALMIVSAFMLAALPAAPAAPAAAQGEKVYLALGDSIAQGDGAPNPETTAYVPRLFNFFRGESHARVGALVNLAIGGETSSSFIAPGGQLDDALAEIATHDIDVVTLDIGGNDFLGLMAPGGPCVDPTSPECGEAMVAAWTGLQENYPIIVGTLHAALAGEPGDPPLIVMTYYNPFSGTGSAFEPVIDGLLLGGDGKLDCDNQQGYGVNDFLACAGKAAGADTYADVYPPFYGKGLELTHIADPVDPDKGPDIHPNNAGHKQIAYTFMEAYMSLNR